MVRGAPGTRPKATIWPRTGAAGAQDSAPPISLERQPAATTTLRAAIFFGCAHARFGGAMRFGAHGEDAVALAVAGDYGDSFGVGANFRADALGGGEGRARKHARVEVSFVGDPKHGAHGGANRRLAASGFGKGNGFGGDACVADLFEALVALGFGV